MKTPRTVPGGTPKSAGAADTFPFRTALSLKPLIEFWGHAIREQECLVSDFARRIQAEVQKAPHLLEPIEDFSVIEKHRSLVDALMTPVFPPASWKTDCSAAIVPLTLKSFYSTPRFDEMRLFDDGKVTAPTNVDEQSFQMGRIINAYTIILKKFYETDVTFDYPLISTIRDHHTGLDRHYRWRFNPRFVDILSLSPLRKLSRDDLKRLLGNLMDLNVWYELLPPRGFEFHGFTVFNAVDVTDQEVLSSIKFDLIAKDSIVSTAGFEGLQQKVRSLLRCPDLSLGLASVPGNKNLFLSLGRKIGNSFILDESCVGKCSHCRGSVYERVINENVMAIIYDLTEEASRTPVEEAIINRGLRNLLLAPLNYQGEMIGLLELGSPNPGDVNAVNAMKLREVLPLFAMATKRGMDELESAVQAVIKEECTGIHASVEWRFRRAAINLIQKRKQDGFAEMEPIFFDGVYPLYGLSDIRDSSALRNEAVQSDLISQLTMAKEIAVLAGKHKPLPFLDELRYRIEKHIAEVQSGMKSGDEVSITQFLQKEVEPLFDHLKGFHGDVRKNIEEYFGAMDPQLGIFYRKREGFEESVALMNDTMSAYIESEEQKAQVMFPHYFEKYKTDGVEHGVYIGASLAEDGKFNPLYLKNLRLWQLMVMCGVVKKATMLKEFLSVPLETAHLILVQDTPLSIRFRPDEKKFDVDGAYNIRYEIMKKRIDKALVKGTHERLTQPGRIAIVYSQPKEAAEYRRYVDFLRSAGHLSNEIEDVELEDLQGIQGLRALRVTVNTKGTASELSLGAENIQEAIQSLVTSVN